MVTARGVARKFETSAHQVRDRSAEVEETWLAHRIQI